MADQDQTSIAPPAPVGGTPPVPQNALDNSVKTGAADPNLDPAQSVLTRAPGLTRQVQHDAWDAYHASADEDELATHLQNSPLPTQVKHDLWEAKHTEGLVKRAGSTKPAASVVQPVSRTQGILAGPGMVPPLGSDTVATNAAAARGGWAAGASPNEIVPNESQEQANTDAKNAAIVAGTVIAPEIVGPEAGLLLRAAATGTGAAAGNATGQVMAGENPVTPENLKESGKVGATVGAADLGLGLAAKGISRILHPTVPEIGDVTEGHFTKAEPGAIPQHGTPVETPQPLDRATVDKLPGGKNLSTEAFDALKEDIGGTEGQEIEAGSSAKNAMHKASAPVQKTLTDTGLEMNKVIQSAPAFKTSTIADPNSTLLSDIDSVRDNLPLKLDDPANKAVDVQMQAAYPALESTNPAEVLAYRRKLGNQIDWSNITNSPETPGEAKNLAQVKIYSALGNKIHAEIPKTAELDKVFQPNLELQKFLDKVGVSRDPSEADAEHFSELAKGKRQLAVNEHNEKVARNRALAWKVLGPVVAGAVGFPVYEGIKHLFNPSH